MNMQRDIAARNTHPDRAETRLATALIALAAMVLFAGCASAKITLDNSGTFKAGGFALEVWSNGGFYATLDGETLIDESGIFTGVNGWMPYYRAEISQRTVNAGAGTVVVKGRFPGTGISFTQTYSTDGASIVIDSKLENADWSALGWAAVEVKFPVSKYAGKKYATNTGGGFYPKSVDDFELADGFKTVQVAPDSAKLNVKIESSSSNLYLGDDRKYGDATFQVGGNFARESNPTFRLKITPPASSSSGGGDEGGSGGGVGAGGLIIHVNQLGFVPGDEKWAIVEDTKNNGAYNVARLQRKFKNGWRTVRQLDAEAIDSRWGSTFMRFNFSEYTQEGTYRVTFDKSASVTFKIGKHVYDNLHADTLGKYLPIQMSHIEVKFGQLGHGACFLDDGIHVGPGQEGPDYFESFNQMEPDSKPGTHLFINVGGWHDAGDYDINVANNSYTLLMLSWAYERYGDKRDEYGIKWNRRYLETGKGNNVPDAVEQIAWGAEWLLRMQADSGRVYDAVVARTTDTAFAEKAPEKLTDNKYFEGSVAPGSVSNTSALRDDRDVYTNTTTPNLLKFVTATAAAARAVRNDDTPLSNRLLSASERAWDYFRSHPQIWVGPHDQYKSGKEQMMLSAAAELYRTTGKSEYLNFIRNNKGWIDEMSVEWPGYINSYGNWFALPFLARMESGDADLRARIGKAVQRWVDYNSAAEGGNIFGINIENLSRYWGSNSDFLGFAATYAILNEEFPTVVPARRGKRYLHWVLGLHPGPDYSFVTGVGANSPRFPHSQLLLDILGNAPGGVPGGVVPGLQLNSNSSRLLYTDHRQICPQNEYTIDSAAGFYYAAQAWR